MEMALKASKLVKKAEEARVALQAWYDSGGVRAQLPDADRQNVESVLELLTSFQLLTGFEKMNRRQRA
jgi:hypothetical protein